MDEVPGAESFAVPGETYDAFMGRYSTPLAAGFAAAAGVRPGATAVDVGCGPGALTSHLASVLGPQSVRACDPSPPFVQACAARNPGVTVEEGRAEAIPFPTGSADVVLAQLVLHFVSDPEQAAREMARVARPGGVVGACMWDAVAGVDMLRAYWDAARRVTSDVPEDAGRLRFGGPGELVALLRGAGIVDVAESTVSVSSTYASFDELWDGFLAGVGPAGAHCVGLADDERATLRDALFARLGSPAGSFTLGAGARCAVGRTAG